MNENGAFPKRKHPRLKYFNYASTGAYYVTICTHNKACLFSRIVGRGLAPAEEFDVEYTKWGALAEQQLLSLATRYPSVIIDRYVIMPNHIHIIFFLHNGTEESDASPTLMDIICTYKSLTTRECRKKGFNGKLFQASFYEHIIRTPNEYENIATYIYHNPARWANDELYSEEY